MNTKMIIGAVALVLVAFAIYLYSSIQTATPASPIAPSTPATTTPSTTTPVAPPATASPSTTDAAQLTAVLGSQYSSLIQDQLSNLSTDQTGFDSQAQDSIASDTSQFYY